MDIHAFTLSWNGLAHLAALEKTLLPERQHLLDRKTGFTWHVRDNGSTDGTVEYLEKLGHGWLEVFRMDHNRDNYSAGNNFLFRKAREGGMKDDDIVLFLNNDIVFRDGFSLCRMLDMFSDASVGVAGAKLLYPSGKIQHAGVVFEKKNGYFPFHRMRGEKDSREASKDMEVMAVTFACAMMRVKCFEGLHGGKLDERFHWCFEDSDAVLDVLKLQGKKVMYCGSTDIVHNESETLKKNPINRIFQDHNFRLFRQKWGKAVMTG